MNVAASSWSAVSRQSVFDGYIIEELLFFVTRLLSRWGAATEDIVSAVRLAGIYIRNCIQSVNQAAQRWKILAPFRFGLRILLASLPIHPSSVAACLEANAQSLALFRYVATFAFEAARVDLKERTFGEAFTLPLPRFLGRLKARLLGTELLRCGVSAPWLASQHFFDSRFREAVEQRHGIKQIVLLSAGYSSRAYRFEALRRLCLNPKKSSPAARPQPRVGAPRSFGTRRAALRAALSSLRKRPGATQSSRRRARYPRTHIPVLEVDSAATLQRKATLLLSRFPVEEISRVTAGVFYAFCDLTEPGELKDCLLSRYCGIDLSKSTLFLMDGLALSFLPPAAVHGLLRTLYDLWVLKCLSRPESESPKCGTHSRHPHRPRWFFDFDFLTSDFVQGESPLYERAMLSAFFDNVRSGLPGDRESLSAMLYGEYRLRLRQLWDIDSLLRTFCPGTPSLWQPLQGYKVASTEFS